MEMGYKTKGKLEIKQGKYNPAATLDWDFETADSSLEMFQTLPSVILQVAEGLKDIRSEMRCEDFEFQNKKCEMFWKSAYENQAQELEAALKKLKQLQNQNTMTSPNTGVTKPMMGIKPVIQQPEVEVKPAKKKFPDEFRPVKKKKEEDEEFLSSMS